MSSETLLGRRRVAGQDPVLSFGLTASAAERSRIPASAAISLASRRRGARGQRDALPGVQGHLGRSPRRPTGRQVAAVAHDRLAVAATGHRLAFPGSRPGGRAAGRQPALHGAVAQGPVWRVRPAAVEQLGVDGVRLPRLDEQPPVVVVDVGLVREQEPRADPARHGAQRQHRCQTAAVCDAAGGEHGQRVDRVHHRWHQGQRGDGTLHVAAGLPPLRHHRVDPGVSRPTRLYRRRDHVHVRCTCGVYGSDVRRGISPRRGHDTDAFVQARPHPAVLGPLQHEVHLVGAARVHHPGHSSPPDLAAGDRHLRAVGDPTAGQSGRRRCGRRRAPFSAPVASVGDTVTTVAGRQEAVRVR